MRVAVDARRPFVALVLGLIALSWLTLVVWGQSPYARYLNHQSLDQIQSGSELMLVFIVGWVVMLLAMMLPTSLPLIVMFHVMTRSRAHPAWLMGLLVTGYLSLWTLFGMGLWVGDSYLHLAVASNRWIAQRAGLFSGLVLLLAGIYQFTPLKFRCLDKCRSPFSFIAEHWRGRNEQGQAFLLGVHHAQFCIGCCWTLMLVMFAVGEGNLGWMLGLAAIMAIEKNASWGRRLTAPLGLALCAAGLIAL